MTLPEGFFYKSFEKNRSSHIHIAFFTQKQNIGSVRTLYSKINNFQEAFIVIFSKTAQRTPPPQTQQK